MPQACAPACVVIASLEDRDDIDEVVAELEAQWLAEEVQDEEARLSALATEYEAEEEAKYLYYEYLENQLSNS